MLVSMPINFHKLVPDNWDQWWDIWNRYALPLDKIGKSPNQTIGDHIGFDVIKNQNYSTFYRANVVDLEKLYPSLYCQIQNLPLRIFCARFVQSRSHFPAHVDNFRNNWSLRCMFHASDPNPQWYYTDLDNKNKKYLYLPDDTNWWIYLDGKIKHGTEFNPVYPKIILQVFAHPIDIQRVVKDNLDLYPAYNIYYD